MSADKLLSDAAKTLLQRGTDYDSQKGERSMAHTVTIYNTITGNKMSEREGWIFMLALKQARMMQGKPKEDTYIDLSTYAALLGECALNGRAEGKQ